MSQQSKGVVPKFGSFKPKAPAKTTEKEHLKGDNRSGDHRRHRRDRSRSKDCSDRRRSRSPKRGRHRDHVERKPYDSGYREQERRKGTPSPKVTKEELEESDSFIIDRRGDKKNVEYGSLHRYSIPAHYRFGNGRVLGAPQDVRIDRDLSTEKQVVLRSTQKNPKQRIPRPLASKVRVADARGVPLIMPDSRIGDLDADDDFVALRPSLKRKRGSESPEPTIVKDVDYRSIEGKAKAPTVPEDEDLEYTDSDDDDVEDAAQLANQQKNAELNKANKESPSDSQAWLSLIEHQASIVQPGVDSSSFKSSQRRALAEIRLAIYDRALKNVPKGKPGYDSLVLGRLKEGATIWENSKLVTKWNEALKDNPTSIEIWIKYLDFVQTDHINFRYERCKEAYIKCLCMLKGARAAAMPDKHAELASTQIYILLRFTSFVRDAGYDELDHAIWQVVLEYHFFKPQGVSKEVEMDALEAFWESDTPRIGEGSTGWPEFYAGTLQDSRSPLAVPANSDLSEETGQGFAGRENELSESLFLPATIDEEAGSDDPFRFVMFEDLKPVVENLLNELPRSGLIDAFLCFMGLPAMPTDRSTTTPSLYHIDPFLCLPVYGGKTFADISTRAISGKSLVKNQRMNPASLFNAFSGDTDHDKSHDVLTFVDQALQRLLTTIQDNDDLAEYYLAFTLNYFPDQAIKSAKRLLKIRPSSLRLYNAYALIEAGLGRFDKAEEAWAAALGMSKSWSDDKRKDGVMLMHSRTMTLVRSVQEDRALRYLVSPFAKPQDDQVGSVADIGAADRLKAIRMFEEGFESMRAYQLPDHAALYIDSLAWLSYLSEDHDVISALAVYDKYISRLSSTTETLTLELLHQAKAELLRMHIESKRPFKPLLIRDILIQSVRLFPNNSLFYEVLSLVSNQTRIDDRLRDAFQQDSRPFGNLGLVGWSYTITKEMERCRIDGSGATANSVRALFAKALLDQDSEVKHSPFLWTAWLDFEQHIARSTTPINDKQIINEDGMKRTRQVLYDGLRALSWYKPWVLMGMECLSEFGDGYKRQIRQLYDVMTEREMRVRAEFDG